MSDVVGLVNMGSQTEVFIGRDYQTKVNYSEKEASIIDEEVRKIIDSCSEVAKNILSKNKKAVKNMVELLLQKETIYSDEVDMIISGKTVLEINEINNEKEKTKNDKQEKSVDEILKMAEERAKNNKDNIVEKNESDINKAGNKKTTPKRQIKNNTKESSTNRKKKSSEDDNK